MVYYYWKFDNAGYERRLNMARKIGIDLGTTNLLICVDNKGILVDEPSIITVDATTKKCIAAGLDARDMLGRTPKNMYPSVKGRCGC